MYLYTNYQEEVDAESTTDSVGRAEQYLAFHDVGLWSCVLWCCQPATCTYWVEGLYIVYRSIFLLDSSHIAAT